MYTGLGTEQFMYMARCVKLSTLVLLVLSPQTGTSHIHVPLISDWMKCNKKSFQHGHFNRMIDFWMIQKRDWSIWIDRHPILQPENFFFFGLAEILNSFHL